MKVTQCKVTKAPTGKGPVVNLTGVAPGALEKEAQAACGAHWKSEFRRFVSREQETWGGDHAVQTEAEDAWFGPLLGDLSARTYPTCEKGAYQVVCGEPEGLAKFHQLWGSIFPPSLDDHYRVAVLPAVDDRGQTTIYHAFLAQWLRFELSFHPSGRFRPVRYRSPAELANDIARGPYRLRRFRKADVLLRIETGRDGSGRPRLTIAVSLIRMHAARQAGVVRLAWAAVPQSPPSREAGLPIMVPASRFEELAAQVAKDPARLWPLTVVNFLDRIQIHEKKVSQIVEDRDRVQKLCEAGVGEACAFWALMVEEGYAGDPDPAAADALRRDACGRNHAAACHIQGMKAYSSCSGSQCPDTRQLLERSCTLGDGEGCFLYANLFLEKNSGPWLEALKRSCAAGHPMSCVVLVQDQRLIAEVTSGERTRFDPPTAARLSRIREDLSRWCRRGNPFGCYLWTQTWPPLELRPEKDRPTIRRTLFASAELACLWGWADTCAQVMQVASEIEEEAGEENPPFRNLRKMAWGMAGCREGSPVSCGMVAMLMSLNLGRHSSAFSMAQAGCRENDALSCFMMGRLIREKHLHPAPEETAEVALGKACRGNEDALLSTGMRGVSCVWWLRELMEAGRWEPVIDRQGDLEVACREGSGLACRLLAQGVEAGRLKAPPSFSWESLMEKGCDDDDPDACLALAGRLESQGLPDAARAGRIVTMYDKACGGGLLEGCLALGRMYATSSQLVPLRTALLATAAACWKHQWVESCARLVDWFDRKVITEDVGQDYVWWNLGECSSGTHLSCQVAQEFFKERKYVSEHLEKTCLKTQDLRACLMMGAVKLLLAAEDGEGREKATFMAFRPVFEEGCAENQPWACHILAVWQEKADGLSSEKAEAFANMKKACELEDIDSCAQLGTYYWNGTPGPQSAELAEKHYRWACARTSGKACTNLATVLLERFGVNGDRALVGEASGILKNACAKYLSGAACMSFGHMLMQGFPGLDKDEKGGMQYLLKACSMSYKPACEEVSRRMQKE
ncbi:MAG: hypothetical protein CVU59_05105 [Deltaproteobacteria bacterium HGW-Deltaproteobacteria-17]|nr:MAG: hypothetical protein CVU59_05105 [Deltaproteobacteria bacterium HGW-Deltaproteobacteria-17]